MFLEELLAWIKKYGSRSIQLGAKEEGAAIKRRLQELLDLEKPIRAEMPPLNQALCTEQKNLLEGRDGLSSLHAGHIADLEVTASSDRHTRLYRQSRGCGRPAI